MRCAAAADRLAHRTHTKEWQSVRSANKAWQLVDATAGIWGGWGEMAVHTTYVRTATSGVLSSCWQQACQSPHHLQQHTNRCLSLPAAAVLHRTSRAKVQHRRTAYSAGMGWSDLACSLM